jgi:L-asparaginase
LVDNLVENGAKGIVFAGAGDGNIYKAALEKLINLSKEKKLLVVRSSRVGAGYVIRGAEINDDENGFVNGDNLNAQKARILLKLALTKSDNWGDVQKIFDRY